MYESAFKSKHRHNEGMRRHTHRVWLDQSALSVYRLGLSQKTGGKSDPRVAKGKTVQGSGLGSAEGHPYDRIFSVDTDRLPYGSHSRPSSL